MESQNRQTVHALVALILLVPMPTIGVLMSMHIEATRGTWIGQTAYSVSKLWIIVLPALWLLFVEKRKAGWSPMRRGGLGVGAALGVIISAIIILAYLTVGSALLDAQNIRQTAIENGIGAPMRYIGLSIYIIAINAVIEEYVWRWFVFEKWSWLVGRWPAVVLAAACFTLHHVFALAAQMDVLAVALGSLGIFIGGLVWSWCYLRYESIWPGYVSHAIVDIAAMVIGWHLIFVAGAG